MISFFLYVLIGISAGFLAGLLGIGGGVIIIPGLASIFSYAGIPAEAIMHMAASTSLTTVIFSSAVAVISQHRSQQVDWNLFRQLALGIVLGTVSGAITANALSSHILKIIFALFMLFIALKILLAKNVVTTEKLQLGKTGQIMVGAIIGFVSGVLGIGGGVISIPIFLRLGLTPHTAAGTSSACVLLLAIVGAISFMLMGAQHATHLPAGSTGYIYWPAVICIAAASMIFVPLGTKFARKLPGATLKKVFAVFLLLVAVEMLVL